MGGTAREGGRGGDDEGERAQHPPVIPQPGPVWTAAPVPGYDREAPLEKDLPPWRSLPLLFANAGWVRS